MTAPAPATLKAEITSLRALLNDAQEASGPHSDVARKINRSLGHKILTYYIAGYPLEELNLTPAVLDFTRKKCKEIVFKHLPELCWF